MEKQTKNVITREFIEKELRFYNTADIRSALVLLCVISLLFVPLTIGVFYGTSSLIKTEWLKILLLVLNGVLISAPVWLALFVLGKNLRERKLLQNRDFDISVCEVQYKDEKIVYRHVEKILHFTGFNDIAVDNVNFALTTPGDEFYVVHYKGLRDVKLLYSLKLYEFKCDTIK